MNADDAYAELRERLTALFNLNPDIGAGALERIYRLASEAGGSHVADVGRLAEELIDHYTASPPKVFSALLLREYFEYLERSARLLAQTTPDGEPGPQTEEESSQAEKHSVAMIPSGYIEPLDWCRMLNRARIPLTLVKAVEACRRRNELLTSVVEYVLVAMQLMDAARADAWQQRYLSRHEGKLDPDVVRDFLNAWLTRNVVPREHLAWAEKWSADDGLRQQWPHVVRRADKLLCRHALKSWRERIQPANSTLAHLRLMVEQDNLADDRLLRWLKGALVDIGESILRFVALNEQDAGDDEQQRRQSTAVMREIRRIEALFTPVILAADVILAVPDGPYQFGIAFFGLVGKGRELWEKTLMALARKAVYKAFLDDLRMGRSSMDTIRTLTFGNPDALRKVLGELDLVSGRFDSMKQRDKVVDYLAVFYASYREPELLAAEIARRYRSLMRLLHEDHLGRVLIAPHLEQVMASGILPDLSSLASDARRFLTRRRSLEMSLEELVAAEMEFEQSIRNRRLRLIHDLVN